MRERRNYFAMIQDRIQEIEARVQGTQNISEESKRDLLNLLATLKAEAGALAATRPEDAQSIAQFAEASAHEAIRSERKPELLNTALQGLTGSVAELEVSHPKVAEAANQMALILANMGI